MNANSKLTAEHLGKTACVYIRQSSLRQVEENLESQDLQYQLVQRARNLGWAEENIQIIDDDLGKSGITAANRNGFQNLVTAVGLDRVGIILVTDVSRLARNCTDWFSLLDLASLRDCLISDAGGIYNPRVFEVFLYRNAPLKKGLIHSQMQMLGDRVGVHVHCHRLRHTCATQLLNAGCRITSIQRFLGHKKLNTTMIYARAHDQTVAEDYFAAMNRVEQRLEIAPTPKPDGIAETQYEVVNVQERKQLLAWVDLLSLPELPQADRLSIVAEMRRELVGRVAPPVQLPIQGAMQVFEEASP